MSRTRSLQAESVVAEPLDTTAEVETPEHVRFRYQLAGPARRSVAFLIDTLVRVQIIVVFVFVAGMAGIGFGEAFAHASLGLVLLVIFVVDWAYFILFETLWSGRTLGKRAMRIRVVTEGGHPLRFIDSVLRNLLRAADFLPFAYALGLVVMARDSRFRRLGDLVAGTMVVVEERQTVTDPLRVEPPPTPAELAGLPERVPLDGDDLEAIELLLRRVSRLGPSRVTELADLVAPIYAKRIGVSCRDSARFLALIYCRARDKGRVG